MPVLRPAAVTLVVGACAVGVLSLAPLRRPGRATRYAVTRMPYRAFMLTQHLAHVVVILTTVS